jgi:hypothetical protein
MKLKVESRTLTVFREEGDRRYSTESNLLYAVKKLLLDAGIPVIKKRMWKDGHLVSEDQTYLRSPNSSFPTFYIYFQSHAIREASSDWNKDREVCFAIDFGNNVYDKAGDPACHRGVFAAKLAEKGFLVDTPLPKGG